MNQPLLLSCAKAAERLSVSTATLYRWRRMGIGPDYLRPGNGRVYYTERLLERWIEELPSFSGTEDYRMLQLLRKGYSADEVEQMRDISERENVARIAVV